MLGRLVASQLLLQHVSLIQVYRIFQPMHTTKLHPSYLLHNWHVICAGPCDKHSEFNGGVRLRNEMDHMTNLIKLPLYINIVYSSKLHTPLSSTNFSSSLEGSSESKAN
jgi:hypothetical protein